MQIIIENCSSAGAQFSKSTNDILLKIYKWINEKNEPSLRFIEFRKRLEKDEGINDNNARNIYPLLKNCGFVNYTPGDDINTSIFFTKNGTAYVLGLKSLELINDGKYTEKQKKLATTEMENVLQQLIYDGVAKLFKNDKLNYSESMKWFVMFLLEYEKINRNEFAYMVYQMRRNDKDWQSETEPTIKKYRNKEITIDVKVRVRNDQKIEQNTKEKTRLEGISFFTAYNYYAALILQAGLTVKRDGYYYLKTNAREKASKLLEI